ncbi:hypothetical protein K2X30_00910 [bacterium]|jgi:hypothetical protein|nr:hypothetical protein [bacterium]
MSGDKGRTDISNSPENSGADLINEVIALTGLPSQELQEELQQIVKNSGHDQESLTLEQLRAAMIAYLEAIQAEHLSNSSAQ